MSCSECGAEGRDEYLFICRDCVERQRKQLKAAMDALRAWQNADRHASEPQQSPWTLGELLEIARDATRTALAAVEALDD